MTDIVERLRGLRFVHVPVASQLMEEAAAEIERLRTLATHATPSEGSVQGRCALTDAEREVLEHEVELAEYQQRHELVAILRKLLERLK